MGAGSGMSYRMTFERGVVRATFFGRLKGADLIAAIEEIHVLELSLPVTPDRIVDLSQLEGADIRQSDVSDVSARRMALAFPTSFRSAIVASRPVELGYARMFQILTDHPQILVQVFSSLEEAEQWLSTPERGSRT